MTLFSTLVVASVCIRTRSNHPSGQKLGPPWDSLHNLFMINLMYGKVHAYFTRKLFDSLCAVSFVIRKRILYPYILYPFMCSARRRPLYFAYFPRGSWLLSSRHLSHTYSRDSDSLLEKFLSPQGGSLHVSPRSRLQPRNTSCPEV